MNRSVGIGVWVSGLAVVAGLMCSSPSRADQGCTSVAVSANDSLAVPVEIVAKTSSTSIISSLSFDLSTPKIEDIISRSENGVPQVTDRRVTVDLTVSVTTDSVECLGTLRYPLGVVLHDAVFMVSRPDEITLQPSNGIANVSFDEAAIAKSLRVLLPLPDGFSFSVKLQEVPTKLDGMTFAVTVLGPGRLGIMSNGEWQLDRGDPDLGLGELAGQLLGKPVTLSAARDEVLSELENQLRSRIKEYLKGKTVDLGVILASNLRIDWLRWQRGDQVFEVDLAWPGADPEVTPILPANAILRFENTTPRLIPEPIDIDAFRSYLANRIVEIAPDAATLDDIMKRFGQIDLNIVPLGWLRVRNATLTSDTFKAEVAFAIGTKNVKWVSVEAPLPLKTSSFQGIINQLSRTAAEAVKEIAKQVAEKAAFDAVKKFIADHGTQTLFGIKWSIELKRTDGIELPPKPVVILRANAGEITIDGATLTIEANGTPRFDYSGAHVTGLESLQNRIASNAGLTVGDLSLKISGLELANSALRGKITGDFLGSAFTAEFIVSEHDVDLKLPGARAAIIASLQSALAGQEVIFSGLQLNDFQVCPDGADVGICANNAYGIKTSFKVADLFSGKLDLQIHPTVKIIHVDVDSSSGVVAALGLFSDGTVVINIPTQFSPLVISGTIRLSNLFEVVPLPDIPFEWSSETGKVHLGMPTTIAIDTDILIPPWLNLSQVRIPIGKSEDGTVTMGMRLTVGEHYVQYVLNIDGTLQANPKAKTVKILGKLSILTLPLYQVDGKLDFDKKEIEASSKTTGLLKAVIPQESIIKVFGEQCLASQEDNVRFLFFTATGSLVVQLPPDFCGTPLPKKAAACGLTNAGGLCLAARVGAGDLGSGDGNFLAGFNLDFTAAVNTTINILIAKVNLGLSANQRQLAVKAKIDAGVHKVKIGLTIAKPDGGSDGSVHRILEEVIRELMKVNWDLSKPINVDSGDDSGDVKVEADDGGEPTMSAMTPVTRDGQPVEIVAKGDEPNAVQPSDTQPNDDTNPVKKATKDNNEQNPVDAGQKMPEVEQKNTAGGGSQSKAIFQGPIAITFDPDNRLRETDTRTGQSEVSADPIDQIAIEAIRGSCSVEWFAHRDGHSIPVGPARADAVVLSSSTARNCTVPINCQADQFCALALRNNGAGAGTIPVDGRFDWPNATGLANQPQRASRLELGVITALAGKQLFSSSQPSKPVIAPEANWVCALKADDGCQLALEHLPDDSYPAFVSRDGTFVEIEDASLSSWAARQTPEKRSEFFASMMNEDITVYGTGDNAWLGSLGSKLTVVRGDGSTSPISGAILPEYGSKYVWRNLAGSDDVLDATASLLAGLDPANLVVTDLGDVEGVHRLLVANDKEVWLLSQGDEPLVCVRGQTIGTIEGKADLKMMVGSSTIEKVASALKMMKPEWRKARFSTNPAIAFFGSKCTN